LVLAGVAFVLGSCGSGGADDAVEPAPPASDESIPATTAADESAGATEPEPADTAPSSTSPSADEAWSDTFAEIVLSPTESGPRPTLSWAAVDGAALYQLTVLDADGAPYWSWSGTESAVPLGGMDNPDAIGAWVFEELTWMVVARGGDGAPLAMSRRGVLEPATGD
jgi:hypothetical protein